MIDTLLNLRLSVLSQATIPASHTHEQGRRSQRRYLYRLSGLRRTVRLRPGQHEDRRRLAPGRRCRTHLSPDFFSLSEKS